MERSNSRLPISARSGERQTGRDFDQGSEAEADERDAFREQAGDESRKRLKAVLADGGVFEPAATPPARCMHAIRFDRPGRRSHQFHAGTRRRRNS